MGALTFDTPIGPMTVHSRGGHIIAADWDDTHADDSAPELLEARRQLTAYFDGARTEFDLPLHIDAPEFQRAVCDRIAAIPFGQTRTYGQIARDMGVPAQAVGGGCGGNPIPVIIPCHRVLGASGLGGFSARGGVETKVWLLRHEGAAGLLI